jgi:hypothetical protein
MEDGTFDLPRVLFSCMFRFRPESSDLILGPTSSSSSMKGIAEREDRKAVSMLNFSLSENGSDIVDLRLLAKQKETF